MNGEGWAASALQIAAAYAAIADGGVYHAPTLVRRVTDGAGHATWEHHKTSERVVDAATAHTLIGMLKGVVNGEQATGKAARIEGVRVAGKTGTAELSDNDDRYYGTFVGIVPAEAPRYVILVAAESKGAGGEVGAPAFARLAKRALSR